MRLDRSASQCQLSDRKIGTESDFCGPDRWLTGTVDEAREMLMLPSVDLIDAGPASDGGRVRG